MGALSGGEQAWVALAKVLREGANLLVFDEPTNDLDLATLGALEDMLEGYPGSVIVVSHDRSFLDRVATAILSFERDPEGGPAIVERHAGGYEDYVSHKREERARRELEARGKREPKSVTPAPSQAPAPAAPKPKAKSNLTYGERIELEGDPGGDRDAAEREVKTLEGAIAEPSALREPWGRGRPRSKRSSPPRRPEGGAARRAVGAARDEKRGLTGLRPNGASPRAVLRCLGLSVFLEVLRDGLGAVRTERAARGGALGVLRERTRRPFELSLPAARGNATLGVELLFRARRADEPDEPLLVTRRRLVLRRVPVG